jgi:cytochrome oxidase Cu insertion factor (SCO1/SenC/PrrC family)
MAGPRPAGIAALAARIDACKQQPDAGDTLVAMLAEEAPLYAGRTVNETEWLRGYILASFETVGLPARAVPFVLEELETGRNPYTVAAAARALRGAATLPADAAGLLVMAIARLRGGDEVVSIERFGISPSKGATTTALGELASTLGLLGPRASRAAAALSALLETAGTELAAAVHAQLVDALDAMLEPKPPSSCCHEHADAGAENARVDESPTVPEILELADVVLENQNGQRLTFAEAFAGRPSALAFFYTRCMNPEKCSLTVTRLARLARRLAAEQVEANIAGISYDPRFDRPGRLRTYGADRAMDFSPRCSLLRTVGPFDPIRHALTLGVGYGPVTVNRHRLELIVLDPSMRITERFERRIWNDVDVVNALLAAGTPLTLSKQRSSARVSG